jgi:hypothetical protein
MEVMPKIETAKLDDLFLDPKNPRLGRHNVERGLSQDEVLELMKDWALEELAVSFLESGYWPQEAMIAVKEPIGPRKKVVLVVVDGNRRLAALKMIQRVRDGQETTSKWAELIRDYPPSAFNRLKDIPYILESSREEVRSYLGFRHVTGIKEWNPLEKAEFIAHLIEHEGLTYEQVRRRVGSKLPVVRQHYVSYRLLLQMEGTQGVDVAKVEERFSVLFLSLRTRGVQKYLQIDIEADPETVRKTVSEDRLEQLANFARWLFGTEKQDPLIADSRQVDDFGKILESEPAVAYLERNDSPVFAVARRMAGIADADVATHVERAADEAEEALKAAHQHRSLQRLQQAVKRLGGDALQLVELFPSVKQELLPEKK